MMKFIADMGISPKTVGFLRDLGYQAVHLHDEGLERLTDSEILEKTRRDESILLTHDLDFGDLQDRTMRGNIMKPTTIPDPTATDHSGKTPRDCADRRGYTELSDLIDQHMCSR